MNRGQAGQGAQAHCTRPQDRGLKAGCPSGQSSTDTRCLSAQGFHLALLRNPGIYKPFIIGISLMVFQQLSGINAVMFYAETIFEEAKFKVKRCLPQSAPSRQHVGGT